MACPICDKTMQGVGDRWFWCPGCGTVLQQSIHGARLDHTIEKPKLIGDANRYMVCCVRYGDDSMEAGSAWDELRHTLGINQQRHGDK